MEIDKPEFTAPGGPEEREENDETTKVTYKSMKKKYRKMRLKFDQKMNQSNVWYKQEQEAAETARRLALENDALLELLLDVNNSEQIPDHQQIDLSVEAPSLSALPPLFPTPSPGDEAVSETETGQQAYRKLLNYLDERMASKRANKPTKSLAHLITTAPHRPFTVTTVNSVSSIAGVSPEMARDLDLSTSQPEPVAYLSQDRYDEFLASIDTRIAGPQNNVAHQAALRSIPHLSDKDLSVRNPVSVYNWLRAHEPKIFLQDGEAEALSGKVMKPGTLRGAGKRASIPAIKPETTEFLDEDNVTYEHHDTPSREPKTAAGANGKRKRASEDDSVYRPKGGATRPSKKKKKEGNGDSVGSGRSSGSKSKAWMKEDRDVDMDKEEDEPSYVEPLQPADSAPAA